MLGSSGPSPPRLDRGQSLGRGGRARTGYGAGSSKGHRSWSAYRPGGDNGFMAAMDRWIFHLNEKHPGSDAPCMAFLPAAQQRLHERRGK